jgi:hypothetical protein
VLTDKEIVALLTTAEQAKRAGIEPQFVKDEPATSYTVQMPVGVAISLDDLRIAITRLNDAAALGYSDVTFTFHDGKLVKRGWILDKSDGARAERPATIELGGRKPKEF